MGVKYTLNFELIKIQVLKQEYALDNAKSLIGNIDFTQTRSYI